MTTALAILIAGVLVAFGLYSVAASIDGLKSYLKQRDDVTRIKNIGK